MRMIYFSSGSELRKFRKQYGLTQDDIANAVRYDKTTICKIECSDKNISARLQARLDEFAAPYWQKEREDEHNKRVLEAAVKEKDRLYGMRVGELLEQFNIGYDDKRRLTVNIQSLLTKEPDMKELLYINFLYEIFDCVNSCKALRRAVDQGTTIYRKERIDKILADLETNIKKYCRYPVG